jgi:predicted ABC-type ATPase
MEPVVVMLAGPNGAGKSTYYEAYLSGLALPFLNADVLANQTGLGPYEAAAEVAAMRDALVAARRGFVTETVLSDPGGEDVRWLRSVSDQGFATRLVYIGIASADLAAERVASRAAAGGHDVPRDKVVARYTRSLRSLGRAIRSLPSVTVYDNSSFERPHLFVAEFKGGRQERRGRGRVPSWAAPFVR